MAKTLKPFVKTIFFSAMIEFMLNICLQAQIYPFREYSALDGLPQSQIKSVFQDSRGYLWIATGNGLSRFDGIEFVNYTRKDGLPSNDVQGVFEDSLGFIWTESAKNGLSEYDGVRFTNFPLGNISDTIPVNAKHESDVIYYVSERPGRPNKRVLRFSKGIYYDYSSQFKAFDTLSLAEVCPNRERDAFIVLDKYHNFWSWKDSVFRLVAKLNFRSIVNENGNIIFRKEDDLFEYLNYELEISPFINKSVQIKADYDYLPSGGLLNLSDGKLVDRIHLPFTPSMTYIDREGVLWLPSEKNMRRLVSTAFTSFGDFDIRTGAIWAIEADKNGHMWFGSLYGDLIEYDGKDFIKRQDCKPLMKENEAFYKGCRRLSNGDLWFSTSTGVIIWDGKRFSRLKSIPDYTQVCYIYEDPDAKKIMIGTDRGLYIIKDRKVACITKMAAKEYGIVEGVTKDKKGRYWLSGHNGVSLLDGDSLTHLDENIYPHIRSYTTVTDKNDGIWVTSEDGLFIKKKSSEKFVLAIPEIVNKPANSIFLMDSSHIMIGRVSDMCIIDIDRFYKNPGDGLRIYDTTDGFEGEDCVDNGIVKDNDGNYWILASNKVIRFEPSRLRVNPHPPELHLRNLYYRDDSLKWEPVSGQGFYYGVSSPLSLNYRQNSIRITYSGISTTNPEKVTYRYRLSGYNNEWSQPVYSREVTYENLPHGSYIFELTAANADGISTTLPVRLYFKIVPGFWQTKLFNISLFVIILTVNLLITWRLFKRRQARIAKEQTLKMEISRLQMSSVLKQFDTHFTFNVISSIGSLIMRDDRKAAYEYITKFSGLLRSVLNENSLFISALADEINFVKNYLELQKLRFKERLDYTLFVDENVDRDREIPKMTIQTFVENAIKHGIEHKQEGGRVDVNIIKTDSCMEITVRDNGIGRTAAMKLHTPGTGKSLETFDRICEKMNKNNKKKTYFEIIDLVSDGVPSGTEVRMVIPDDFDFNSFFRLFDQK